jgi:aromatic ring-opening dioxygenase catalytic subunit (LigB family)
VRAGTDLVEGFNRLRRIDAVRPDTLIVFDTHWFTTGFHLIDAGPHYRGTYISDEMPWSSTVRSTTIAARRSWRD